MHFDDMAIGVLQEYLIPAGDRPAAIVRITDVQLVAPTHETLDVVRAETEVTVSHWIDRLLHLEAGIQVALGPMKFDVAVSQEIDLAHVGAVSTVSAHYGMLVIRDRTQFKQILVEARQPGKVVRAQVHMMELKLHSIDSFGRLVFIIITTYYATFWVFACLKLRPIWSSGGPMLAKLAYLRTNLRTLKSNYRMQTN
jgi:hypothetical protein